MVDAPVLLGGGFFISGCRMIVIPGRVFDLGIFERDNMITWFVGPDEKWPLVGHANRPTPDGLERFDVRGVWTDPARVRVPPDVAPFEPDDDEVVFLMEPEGYERHGLCRLLPTGETNDIELAAFDERNTTVLPLSYLTRVCVCAPGYTIEGLMPIVQRYLDYFRSTTRGYKFKLRIRPVMADLIVKPAVKNHFVTRTSPPTSTTRSMTRSMNFLRMLSGGPG